MTIRVEYHPPIHHAEAIRAIDAECFPNEPWSVQDALVAMQEDFWAAWDDDTLAGYVRVLRKPDVSWVARVATDSAHRRRGVATALLQAALTHCEQIGLPETILYVRTENPDARRLYQRFGFRESESTWQFVLANPQERLSDKGAKGIAAIPIHDVPEPSLPTFPREWANIAAMHQPPGSVVLIFREGPDTIGYCRLNPEFPGCFPFVVEQPAQNLLPALCSLKRYLHTDKPLLKLTIWDPAMAEACRDAGMELNYELLKMLRKA